MDTCQEFKMQVEQIIKDDLENRLAFDKELLKLAPYENYLREILKTCPELFLDIFNELLSPLMA